MELKEILAISGQPGLYKYVAQSKNGDYWNVFFEHNEEFYKELPKHGLSFPFPQMDVHMKKE